MRRMLLMKDGIVKPAVISVDHAPDESGASETGWHVHVVGPDDVIAYDDEVAALRHANALNTHMEKERREFANDDNYPYCIAIVRRGRNPLERLRGYDGP